MSMVALCLLGLAGCGEKTAPEKCDDLLVTVCSRTVECVPELGSQNECEEAIRQVLPCGMAESVSSSYGRCMEQLDDNSCASLFPRDSRGNASLQLPADCTGVIEGPDGFGGDVRISAVFGPVSPAAAP